VFKLLPSTFLCLLLRRSIRQDHKHRITLADGDDRLDRFVVLLPRNSQYPPFGQFPCLEVGTADNTVAFDAAQPSERMRPSDNSSRARLHVTTLYATKLPNENTRRRWVRHLNHRILRWPLSRAGAQARPWPYEPPGSLGGFFSYSPRGDSFGERHARARRCKAGEAARRLGPAG